MKKKCPFCHFRNRDLVLYQDDLCYAVVSTKPINKYHVLIIPRQHYAAFVNLPDNVASRIFLVAKRLSKAVRKVCRPHAISHLSDDAISWKGFKLVAHYKFHIIPRYKNDKVEIDWHREKDPGIKARLGYASEIRKVLES